MKRDNVFIIGDVHGHLDRLEALLKQEGLLVWCEFCNGSGQVMKGSAMGLEHRDCKSCKGIGWRRAKPDTTVVQLGDLGHFGDSSPTGDLLCYKYVTDNNWVDVVLWGNHDRALVDSQHAFNGYLKNHEAIHHVIILHKEGRLQLAFSAHGFLITHAGLALAFRDQNVAEELKTDPAKLADWLNDQDEIYLADDPKDCDPNSLAVRDAIGGRRGGPAPTGGILWRDIEEKLYDGFRQIFGHSADREGQVRHCWKNGNVREPGRPPFPGSQSYCIDVGGKNGSGNDCLAGIWLPSEKIVRVDL